VNDDLISIIIPIYNVKKYLARCLDSVLQQTHPNLEIILINDGSTDGSDIICEEYKQKDPRIIVVHKENGGVSSARNLGLDIASGEWIGFVDSDDYVEPDMMNLMLSAAISSKKDISICAHTKHHPNRVSEERVFKQVPLSMDKEQAIGCVMSLDFFEGYLCTKVFRRNVIFHKECAGFDVDIHFSEDTLFVISALLESNGCCYVPKPLYHHCLRPDCATLTYNKKRLTELDAWTQIAVRLDLFSHKLATIARIRHFDAATYLMYLAAKEKDFNTIKQLKKQTKSLLLYFFTHKEIKFKHKARNALIFLFPRFSAFLWSVVKRLRRDMRKVCLMS